jgi:hypothetical protein
LEEFRRWCMASDSGDSRMKGVCVVTKFKIHEDVWICKVFAEVSDAVEYCDKFDGEGGYIYEWDYWEVE